MPYRLLKYILLTAVLLATNLSVTNAQRSDRETERQKAVILYNVPKYLKWPGSDGNYKIGLLGASKFLLRSLSELEETNYPHGKSFKTIFIQSPREAASFTADMLYISAEYNEDVSDIMKALKNKPTVIITEEWSEKKSVMINLIEADGIQTFEINPTNINNIGVNVLANIHQSGGLIVDDRYLYNESERNLQEERERVKKQQELLRMQQIKLQYQLKTIAKQEEKIEGQQHEIKKQQEDIVKQRKELESLISRANQNRRELAEKIAVLRDKEKAIEEQNQRLIEQKAKADEQSKVLEKQNEEIEKRQKQINQQRVEIASQTGIIRTQKNALLIFGVLLGFIILLSFFLFRSYRTQKKQNKILESQKNEIEIQAVQLEQVNKELEKLSIVASETSNAVAILRPNGKYEWVNAGFTRMYGYTLQLLRNEVGEDIYTASTHPQIHDIIKKCIEQQSPVSYESKVTTRNNEIRWSQTTISPTINNQDIVERLVLIDTDITEVKEAEAEIAKQNKKITDSIVYAKRIQKAVLTPKEIIASYIPEHFIMFRPRDIVSGDFYWAAEKDNKLIITAADCTGHGVPGAFMSMLGITFLNQIIAENRTENITASFILEELRDKVKTSLRQTGKAGEAKDGMDMALCIIDKENMNLEFSGAQNPLLRIRNGETERIKGDDMPIGISYGEKKFTNHTFKLLPDDRLYIFSDGYADQFGEKTKKKFYSKRLSMMFEKYHEKPFKEQLELYEKTFDKWRGKLSQMDDVLLIGLKI